MSDRVQQFKVLRPTFIFIILFLFAMFSGCTNYKTTDSVDNIISETTSSEESLPVLDKNTLENWGDFESVASIYTRINRNLENPNYVLVTLKNVVVLRGGDSTSRNSMTDNIWVINEESLLESNRISASGEIIPFRDNEKIKVFMKDDSTNRVVQGDYITVTGILDTKNIMIFDSECEMIKPVE